MGSKRSISRDDVEGSTGVFSPRYSHAPDYIAETGRSQLVPKFWTWAAELGFWGLYALRCGAGSLVAIDKNPRACENARLNVAELGFRNRATVLEGDTYGPLSKEDKFDVIIMTPPYWNKAAGNFLEAAFYDGEYQFLSSSILGAAGHLNPEGRVFLGFSDQGDLAKVAQLIQKSGLHTKRFLLQRPTMRDGHSRILTS